MAQFLPVPIDAMVNNPYQVSLLGPPNSGGHMMYSNFCEWSESVLLDWTIWCQEYTPKGCWSYSSDTNRDIFRLHVWFEHKDDAIVFKLKHGNYS